MPATTNATRFRELFIAWRGAEIASRKESFILSATAISQFVAENTLSSINIDLVYNSPVYNTLNENYDKNKSALIFITLALKDYYLKSEESNNFYNGERALLNSIIVNLQEISKSPSKKSSSKFNTLVLNITSWLNSLDFTDKDLALTNNTLLSIYTIFRFVSIRLDHINGQEKTILKFFFNSNDAKRELELILGKLSLKMAEIEALIRPATTGTNVAEGSTDISAKWPLDSLYLNIIRKENISLQQKVEQIQALILGVNGEIQLLINEKQNRATILKQLDYCVKIISAANAAEKKGGSLNLAIELWNSNRDSFNELISHTTAEEQAKLTADLSKLESLSLVQQATNAVKYGLATPINYLSGLIHTYAPALVQDTVDYLSPIDLEKLTLVKLKLLAESRLPILRESLKASDIAKAEIATTIANGDEHIKQFLEVATRFKLEEIFLANLTIIDLLTEFEGFANKIVMNKVKLEEIRGLNDQIDRFIEKHDGFIVHLSLFLSNICPLFSYLFKTETAAKIEEVKIIKNQLLDLKTAYKKSNNDTLKLIDDNENISPKLKGEILDIISAEQIRPVPQIIIPNIITAFTKIKTMFSSVSTIKPIIAEDNNHEEELLLRRI